MVSLTEQEQESLDISNIVGVAQTLVETLRDINNRLCAVEEQVQYLKQKEEQHRRDG